MKIYCKQNTVAGLDGAGNHRVQLQYSNTVLFSDARFYSTCVLRVFLASNQYSSLRKSRQELPGLARLIKGAL